VGTRGEHAGLGDIGLGWGSDAFML
jgi:hypothetical protein